MFDAVVGGYNSSEVALADKLIGRLEPGILLLADRGFYSFGLWRKAIGTGADLWRVKTGLRPEHLATLDDNSWLAAIRPTVGDKTVEPITVRVIDDTVDDGRDKPEPYRLFTSILDPAQASATELAEAYPQRWEVELAFDSQAWWKSTRPTSAVRSRGCAAGGPRVRSPWSPSPWSAGSRRGSGVAAWRYWHTRRPTHCRRS